MQLRDFQSWPPYRVGSLSEAGTPHYLRRGTLREAHLIPGLPRTLIIYAEYAGDIQAGLIDLSDSNHRDPIYHKLKANLGKPLTEIENLEIEVNYKI